MKEDSHPTKDELSESIIKVLCYFDIFSYPLTPEEVLFFLSTNHVAQIEVNNQLNLLKSNKKVFNYERFYTTKPDASLAERRKKGNKQAEKILPKALKQANLIQSFPFVKSVMASGSFSKGYIDENSDLDFFVITEPKRLWITRTLLALYKRVFLFNSHKFFCINYFIASDQLEIDEKNLFTAIELATLIPLTGNNLYQELISKNTWLFDFMPNFKPRLNPNENNELKKNKVCNFAEGLLRYRIGNLIESICMRIALKRWERLYRSNYSKEDFNIAFKSTKGISKNHPRNYQKKVKELYEEKLLNFPVKLKSNWNYEA